jgi:uncharacterized protein (DUF427 family)
MSLTLGTGPFGSQSQGSFNFEKPETIEYLERSPRWVRGRLRGETVVDSRNVRLLHETGKLPVWLFPEEDVRLDLLPQDAVRRRHDLVQVDFGALDEWLEEDEVQIGHPRDPYHRIDVRNTSRHVRVELDGELIAESDRAVVLFETGLPPRWYLPREDVRAALEPSDHRTVCAYKGEASHYSIGAEESVAWSYPDPLPEVAPIRDRIAFYDEHVDLEVDGEHLERPETQWSRRGT